MNNLQTYKNVLRVAGILAFCFIQLLGLEFIEHGNIKLNNAPNVLAFIFYILLILSLGTYVVKSIKSVGPSEIGIILFFGKPLFQLNSGVIIVPVGIFKLSLEKSTITQDEYPNSLEPAIMMLHGKSHANDLGNPLNVQLSTPINFTVTYRINNLNDLLKIIGNQQDLRKQLGNVIIIVAQHIIAMSVLSENLMNNLDLNDKIKTLAVERTKDWGIEIISIGIRIDISMIDKSIIERQKEVIKAHSMKEVEEIKKVFIGVADAEAERRLLTAKANGYKEIADKLGMKDADVLTMIDIIENSLKGSKANGTADQNTILKVAREIKNSARI